MKTVDAPVKREERRFRRARLVLFAIVGVCLLQIGWWIYFQIRASNREFDDSTRLGEPVAQADALRWRRVRMSASEGGFLMVAVIGGVVSIYWLLRRELRREYEQNQLLAAMSHDFRSPLTAIRLLAQSFEMDRVKESERQRVAETLVANVQRLEELVENVLVAARFHAGRLAPDFVTVDLSLEVEAALDQRHSILAHRGAEVTRKLERGVRVEVDRTLLQSILGNLIDNAVKYADGLPRMTVTVATRDGHAELRVRDLGVGFPPGEAKHLFDRFHRGSAEQDKSRPGLGLGLFLVREFTRLHGGEVAAESAGPGRGCEFTVRLPLTKAGPAPAAAPAEASA
jgi:signal transduction histidine kinase